jgi:hypothetical protein
MLTPGSWLPMFWEFCDILNVAPKLREWAKLFEFLLTECEFGDGVPKARS